jgi:GTPase SAR1 family protein
MVGYLVGKRINMQASRFYNNSGPVNEVDHLCVSPIKRLDTNKVWQLILQKKYFLICGPKQCGKTSYLLALAKTINRNNFAKCLYFNVESLRGVQENLEESIRSVLFEISSRARDTFGDDYLEELVMGILERRGPYQALNEFLTQWSKHSDKPIVLLVDEIDTLQDKVLTSILSQIRAGYDKRPAFFPQSIIFCATHDVIDKQFNIKDATLRLSFLRREDLDAMFKAQTEKHGIDIDKETIDRIWRYSAGQPWIISTLAGELFHEIAPAKGLSRISAEQVDEAIDNIIIKKGNHLEYLISKLQDDRVKRCLIPILSSGTLTQNIAEQDFTFIQELGLIKIERNVEIANDLYKEIIPRALIGPVSYMINLDGEEFLQNDGRIDTLKLLRSFQSFFRNHSDRLINLIDYGVAGYVLIFQALLQRLVDANNMVSREYGIGQGRIVLRLKRSYPVVQHTTFILNPIRVWSYEKFKPMIAELVEEAAAYVAASPEACGEVHVVAININPEFAWEGKMPYQKNGVADKVTHFWGF